MDLTVSDYVLSGTAGLGLIGNVLIITWHIRSFSEGLTVTMKYLMLFLDVSYFLQGLALLLFILWKVFDDDILCQAGGYFAMFASQMTVCFLASSSLLLLLWRMNRITHKTEQDYWIVLLVVALFQFVTIGFFSFLPLTDKHLFDSNDTTPFACLPVRLVNQQGWIFSFVIVIFQWAAIFLSLGCNMAAILKSNAMKRTNFEQCYDRKSKRISIALFIETACWVAVLAIFSYAYFLSPQNGMEGIIWTLVLYSSGMNVMHPVVQVIFGTSPLRNILQHAESRYFAHDVPKTLNVVTQTQRQTQSKDCGYSIFKVEWSGKISSNKGTMKVYSPDGIKQWTIETDVLKKLTSSPNRNIAKCLWVSKTNKYTAALRSLTGNTYHRNSRIICMEHVENGSLRQFLQTNVSKLTEATMRRLAVDIASGLKHLHGLGIVHNKLTSCNVYIHGSLQTMALTAVIGDFNGSSDFNGAKDAPTSSGAVQAEDVSSDIRSYGLVLLEMIGSLSRYRLSHVLNTKNGNRESVSSQSTSTTHGQRSTSNDAVSKKWEIPIAKRKLPLIPLMKTGRDSVLSDVEGEIDILLHSAFEPNSPISNRSRLSSASSELSPIFNRMHLLDETLSSGVTKSHGNNKSLKAHGQRSTGAAIDVEYVDSVIANVHKTNFEAYKICYDTTSLANVSLSDPCGSGGGTNGTPRRMLPATPIGKQNKRSSYCEDLNGGAESEIECWEEEDAVGDVTKQTSACDNSHIQTPINNSKCRRAKSTNSVASRDSGIYSFDDSPEKSPDVFRNIPRNRDTIYAGDPSAVGHRAIFARGSLTRKPAKIYRRVTRESISSIDSGFSHGHSSDYYRSNLSTTDSFMSTCIREEDELGDEDIYSTIGEASVQSDGSIHSGTVGDMQNCELPEMESIPEITSLKENKRVIRVHDNSGTYCYDNQSFDVAPEAGASIENRLNVAERESVTSNCTPRRQLPTPKRQANKKTIENVCEECYIDEHFLNHPLATVKSVSLCDHCSSRTTDEDSRSVNSLIIDSTAIIEQLSSAHEKNSSISQDSNGSTKRSTIETCPRQGVRSPQLEFSMELSAMFLELDYDTLVRADREKMYKMTDAIITRGSLGAIAKQMMETVHSCWLRTPTPQISEALVTLRRSLPTTPNTAPYESQA